MECTNKTISKWKFRHLAKSGTYIIPRTIEQNGHARITRNMTTVTDGNDDGASKSNLHHFLSQHRNPSNSQPIRPLMARKLIPRRSTPLPAPAPLARVTSRSRWKCLLASTVLHVLGVIRKYRCPRGTGLTISRAIRADTMKGRIRGITV